MDRKKQFIRWSVSDNENITFKSPVLCSDLCDYSGAYIVGKELTIQWHLGVFGIIAEVV